MAFPALEQFLRHRFSSMDAGLLMVFFNHLAGRDFFSDGDLDLPEAEKKDLILLDFFVISGMMSPCPHKSLRTGLSFYEVSPVLFWGNPISGGS